MNAKENLSGIIFLFVLIIWLLITFYLWKLFKRDGYKYKYLIDKKRNRNDK